MEMVKWKISKSKILENWCTDVWRIDAAADRDSHKIITSSRSSSCMMSKCVCVKARSR
jgi:hypothetical protein